MNDLAVKLRGAQLLRPTDRDGASVCTSCVSFVKTSHAAARTHERKVDTREVQACLKHGVSQPAKPGSLRLKHGGVVVVTTLEKRVVTAWRVAPKREKENRALARFAKRICGLVRHAFNAWRHFPHSRKRHLKWLLGIDNKLVWRQVDLANDLKLLFCAWKLLVHMNHAKRVTKIVCINSKRDAAAIVAQRNVFNAWLSVMVWKGKVCANGSIIHAKSLTTCERRSGRFALECL